MVPIVEANMDVCTVPTIPCYHIYKVTSSHVPIWCSHVPNIFVHVFIYTHSYVSTRHSCVLTSIFPRSQKPITCLGVH